MLHFLLMLLAPQNQVKRVPEIKHEALKVKPQSNLLLPSRGQFGLLPINATLPSTLKKLKRIKQFGEVHAIGGVKANRNETNETWERWTKAFSSCHIATAPLYCSNISKHVAGPHRMVNEIMTIATITELAAVTKARRRFV